MLLPPASRTINTSRLSVVIKIFFKFVIGWVRISLDGNNLA